MRLSRRGNVVIFGAAIGIAWLFLDVSNAGAIPAFARKYDMDCSHCHTIAPKLNRLGERFHEKLSFKGLEEELPQELREKVRSEDPEDQHPAYWPVSIRAAIGYQSDKRDNQLTSGGVLRTVDTRGFGISQFQLMAGGLLASGVAYYVTYFPAAQNVGFPGQPPVHVHPGAESGAQQGGLGFAWIRLADILGEHGFDLQLGSYELELAFSGHLRLTNSPYLAFRYKPEGHDTSFALDAPQLGVAAEGETPFFGYFVSVYNGSNGATDTNRAPDLFTHIKREVGEHELGIFALRGLTPTTSSLSTTGGVIPGTGSDNQPYLRIGADASLNFGPLNLMLFYLHGQDDAQLFQAFGGPVQTARYHGALVEGDYMIESWRTMLIGRYDLIRNSAQGITTLPRDRNDADALTLGLRRDLVLTSRANLQLHLEANATRTRASSPAPAYTDQTANTLFTGLDLAF